MRKVTLAVTVGLMLAASQARADETRGKNGDDETAKTEKSEKGEKRDTTSCDGDGDEDGCSCHARCCGRHGHCHEPSVSLDVAGVRPSFTHVSTAGTSKSEMGVGFAGIADSYALDGTAHAQTQWLIGGGQAGF